MRTCHLIASAAIAMTVATATAQARETVSFNGGYAAGTIVIRTNERRLYLVLGNGQAIRYMVGVGRAGKQWAGTSRIEGKYIRPAWSPPDEVRRDKPSLPSVIPGGSPRNPMGVAAMTLAGGEYGTQRAGLGRRLRVLWLHPHVQPGHQRSFRARERRHHRGGDAIS